MAARKSPRRALRPDERALWDHVAQTVRRRLLPSDPALQNDPETIEPDAPDPTAPPEKRHRRPVPPPASAPAAPPTLTHDMVAGMDGNTARRLKRGKLPIDRTLDLHGHTQARAHQALHRLIADAFENGERTVLVITGKGGRDGTPGVLRHAVPAWLNDMPLRQWVSGFTYAAPRDGGEGALYVRIKRRR